MQIAAIQLPVRQPLRITESRHKQATKERQAREERSGWENIISPKKQFSFFSGEMGAQSSLPTRAFIGSDPLSWRFSLHVARLLYVYRYNNFDFGVDRRAFTDLLKVSIVDLKEAHVKLYWPGVGSVF